MRFPVIAAEKARHTVTILCRCLRVTRSGFYAWARRGPSVRTPRDRQLGVKVRACFAAKCAEVGIRGDQHPIFCRGPIEDFVIGSVVKANIADGPGVVARMTQEFGKDWRERVVDQQPHGPAARGNVRSLTASAAKNSASRTSSASRSG